MKAIILLAVLAVGCGGRNAADANARGVECGRRGDFSCAAKEFAVAVQQDPNSAKYHYNLAFALAKRGLIDQAAMEARRSLEIDPAYSDSSRLLAWANERMADRQADAVAAVTF